MEQRNYKLYVHIAPNGKRYYGITCQQNINRRWDNGRGYKTQLLFNRAINKYGWDNFEHIVLFDNLTKEEACLLEQCYIVLYDTMNPKYGYNSTSGGEHCTFSEQTRKKLSERQMGEKHHYYGKHLTEEHRRKISEAHKGENNYWYGKHLSEETKKKMSESSKGNKNGMYGKTPWNKGKHHSEETKKKISESHKGDKHPMYGKHFSEEHNKKLSEAKKGKNNPASKPVLMFTLDGQFIKRFDCRGDANEYLGKPRNNTNIYLCARGKQTTAFGYKWIYEEDYIKEQEQAI